MTLAHACICVFGQFNAWFEDWLTTRRSPEPGADVTHSLPTVQELVPPCQVCSLLLLLYLYCNCSSACFALRNTVLLSITVLYIGVIVCRPVLCSSPAAEPIICGLISEPTGEPSQLLAQTHYPASHLFQGIFYSVWPQPDFISGRHFATNHCSPLGNLLNCWPKPIILPRICFKGYSIQCDHGRISSDVPTSQGDILCFMITEVSSVTISPWELQTFFYI